jgi:DNA-directed RNA polymerase specialized sigma24 family protein
MGLTQEALDKLLAKLDQDRDVAGQKYELIRCRLVKFFEVRGCLFAEDLADEAINRTARRILEGAAVPDVLPYSIGVARLVFKESKDKFERRVFRPEDWPAMATPTPDRDHKFECFETCLELLTPEDREMIITYYRGERATKIRNRKQLADRTGLGENALRIRTHRIRVRLAQCVEGCLNQVNYTH